MREKNLTSALSVRLAPDQIDAIDAMVVTINAAKALGALDIGRTEVIRRAVAEYIERHREPSRETIIEASIERFEALERIAAEAIPSQSTQDEPTSKPRGGKAPPKANGSPRGGQRAKKR